jgi:hypothetical protein
MILKILKVFGATQKKRYGYCVLDFLSTNLLQLSKITNFDTLLYFSDPSHSEQISYQYTPIACYGFIGTTIELTNKDTGEKMNSRMMFILPV